MLKFAAFILLIFISCNLKAQTWELGTAFGAAGYMGDLNANNPVKVSGVALGGYVKRNFNGYLSAKINYTYGTIRGTDSTSNDAQFRARNLSFTTTLSEVSLIGEFNFMKYIPEAGKNKFTPFIYLGFAAVNYFPHTVYKGQTYELRGYETEGEKKPYSKTAFAVPYGAGFKYNITGKWTLAGDIGYRNPNTDYLDDVSGVYPAKVNNSISSALSDRSGEKTGIYIGTPGSQRGDLNPRDTYFFLQFTLAYTFVTEKCYFTQ
jgi:hypothetical protein